MFHRYQKLEQAQQKSLSLISISCSLSVFSPQPVKIKIWTSLDQLLSTKEFQKHQDFVVYAFNLYVDAFLL